MNEFALVLRDRREKHHLSVKDLSVLTHISARRINALENEKTFPTPKEILKLSMTLDLDEASILTILRYDFSKEFVT